MKGEAALSFFESGGSHRVFQATFMAHLALLSLHLLRWERLPVKAPTGACESCAPKGRLQDLGPFKVFLASLPRTSEEPPSR